jgi:hypothetical protein
MDRPQKLTGWTQGLFETSATQKEALGALRITEDGRKFRYAKSGEALVAGKNGLTCDAVANHIKLTGTNAVAKGVTKFPFTVGATAVTENQYKDGYLQVYDGAAGTVGYQYRIRSNTACDASGVTVLELEDPIQVAILTTDTLSLIPNPFSSITQQGSLAHGLGGVVPITVATTKYFWMQTGGLVCGLNGGGSTLGAGVVQSATEGAFKTQPDGALDAAPSGHVCSFAAVDTKYSPIWLQLD